MYTEIFKVTKSMWPSVIMHTGPGAGEHGGNVLIADTPKNVAQCENSVTGQYLSGKKSIAVPSERTPALLQPQKTA